MAVLKRTREKERERKNSSTKSSNISFHLRFTTRPCSRAPTSARAQPHFANLFSFSVRFSFYLLLFGYIVFYYSIWKKTTHLRLECKWECSIFVMYSLGLWNLSVNFNIYFQVTLQFKWNTFYMIRRYV